MGAVILTRDNVKGQPVYWLAALFLLSAAGIYTIRVFCLENPVTLLGLILTPVVARTHPGQYSARFLFPAAAFAITALLVQMTTLAFFAWIFTLFALVESRLGRLNFLPLCIAAIVSPVFNYVAQVFSFSLRLELSAIAAKILSVVKPAAAEGNLIIFNGEEFSVDPACMGLKLTVTALLIGVVFLAKLEKQEQRSLPASFIATVLCLFFGLIVLANLIRILMLVILRIMPETVLHEIVGLLCLLYVAVPGYFLVSFLYKYWPFAGVAKSMVRESMVREKVKSPVSVSLVTLLTLIMLLNSNLLPPKSEAPTIPPSTVAGLQISHLRNDVVKLENETSLIYLKKIPDFYSGEHNPAICWLGSGYDFKKVKESSINGRQVYLAELVKGDDVLFTAWWYQNPQHSTISQLDWRKRVLSGEPKYYLVNVTAETRQELELAVQKMQQQKWLSGLLL